MPIRTLLFAAAVATCILSATFAWADQKVIEAEGAYVMGDGETPNFGESMALQKAKQSAVEQAGIYVQSYTQTKGMDITVDEIRTVAGGVLQVEVLAKSRLLLKDGGERFSTKIRAIVKTDGVDEFARRIKGGKAAGENREVIERFARIEETLLRLQQEMKRSKSEVEREHVIESIQEVERQFRQARSAETALFKRLLSGNDLLVQANKALSDQYQKREAERQRREIQQYSLKHVLDSLRGDGLGLVVGPPDVVAALEVPDMVTLTFPSTLVVTDRLKDLVKNLKKAHGGDIPADDEESIEAVMDDVKVIVRISLKGGGEVTTGPRRMLFKGLRSYDLNHVLVDQTFSSRIELSRQDVERVDSVEGLVQVGTGVSR